MSLPFVFGKIAENQDFIGREDEVSRLSSNLTYQKNTLILSRRGWGKSSLLNRISSVARSRDYQIRICRFSMYDVASPEEFCSKYAQSIISAVSGTLAEAASDVRKYLHGTSPLTKAEVNQISDFSLSFDTPFTMESLEKILDLPDLLAKDRNLKVVVCIDDFQNVSTFSDPESFLDKVDMHWSSHKNASYCLCADMTEQMELIAKRFDTFKDKGQVVRVDKIPSQIFVEHIRNSFADTGKYIDDEAAFLVVDLVEGHPHYVQQLAKLSWLRTSVVCPKETVKEAHSSIADQMSLVFKVLTESLTMQQKCYLRALLCGETVISSSDVLHRYGISSATSASRSKAALISRNIIYVSDGRVKFHDPLYSYWLKTRYFNL